MTTRTNYKSILDLTEIYVGWALRSQVLEETDLDYGGFRCPENVGDGVLLFSSFAEMLVF